MADFMKFFKDLEDFKRRQRQRHDEYKADFVRYMRIFEKILISRTSSEAQKVKASLGMLLENDKLERLTYELIDLNNLFILTCHLGILKETVDAVNKKLTQSGISEKVEAIGDVTKLKQELQKAINLLNGYYQERRKMEQELEEARKRSLSSYVG